MRLIILLLLVPHIRADGDAPNRTAVVFVAVPSQDIPADAALRQAVRQTWAPALERGGGALRFFVERPLRIREELVVVLDDAALRAALGHARFVRTASVAREALLDKPPDRKYGCGSTRWTDFVVGMAGWARRHFRFDWWLRLDADVVLCVEHTLAALRRPPFAPLGARVVYAGHAAHAYHRRLCAVDEFFLLLSAGAARARARVGRARAVERPRARQHARREPAVHLRGAPLRPSRRTIRPTFSSSTSARRADAGRGRGTRVLALHRRESPDELIQAHGRAARMPARAWQPTPARVATGLQNGSGSVWSGCEAPTLLRPEARRPVAWLVCACSSGCWCPQPLAARE